MIHKYSDYITLLSEGLKDKPDLIYWNFQLEDILNKEWSEISSSKIVGKSNIFSINFKINTGNYYSVLVENKGNEIYYLENFNSKKFESKLKIEFFKNEEEYIKNFNYDPKCLGDINYLRDARNFNL